MIWSGTDGTFVRKLTDTAGASSDQLGISIAGIGDVTGDGTPDIAAGSNLDDAPASNQGSVVVFNSVTGAVVQKIVDPAGLADDRFGAKITALPDIDGDGTGDLLIAADFDDTPAGANAGSIVVVALPSGIVLDRFSDADGAASDRLGASAAAGDLPPHPGPLPQGEGEPSPALPWSWHTRSCRETGLDTQASRSA